MLSLCCCLPSSLTRKHVFHSSAGVQGFRESIKREVFRILVELLPSPLAFWILYCSICSIYSQENAWCTPRFREKTCREVPTAARSRVRHVPTPRAPEEWIVVLCFLSLFPFASRVDTVKKSVQELMLAAYVALAMRVHVVPSCTSFARVLQYSTVLETKTKTKKDLRVHFAGRISKCFSENHGVIL